MNQAQVGQLVRQGVLTEEQAKQVNIAANIKSIALANMQMNRAGLHSLVQQVNALPPGSPQRQNLENTLAMMYQAVNNENFNIADRAAAASALAKFGNNQGGGSEGQFQNQNRMLRMSGNEPLAKDMESKHLPGIPGQASGPLSEADKDKFSTGLEFDQKLDRFINWTKNHSGDISPSDKHTGQAMASELQGAYRQATHGGVYKEGEQNFISSIISSTPTVFFNKVRVLPQLNAVSNEMKQRMNTFLKSKGFQGYPAAQKDQANQSGPVQGKDGKMYQLDPSGKYMIPVGG